jgi:hypothetical protein
MNKNKFFIFIFLILCNSTFANDQKVCVEATQQFFKNDDLRYSNTNTLMRNSIPNDNGVIHQLKLNKKVIKEELSKKKRSKFLLWMIQHVGLSPSKIIAKDVKEKGFLYLSYIIKTKEKEDYRLVLKYNLRTKVAIESVIHPTKLILTGAHIVPPDFNNIKIAKKHFQLNGPDFLDLFTSLIGGKSSSTSEVVENFIKNYDTAFKESDHYFSEGATQLTEELKKVVSTGEDYKLEAGVPPIQNALKRLRESNQFSFIESDIDFYNEFSGPILDDFLEFSDLFFYNANRNSKGARTQEDWQSITTTKELKKYIYKLKLRKFAGILSDRTLKQSFAIPFAVGTTFIFAKLLDDDKKIKPVRNSHSNIDNIEKNQSPLLDEDYLEKQIDEVPSLDQKQYKLAIAEDIVELSLGDQLIKFNTFALSDGNVGLIPIDPIENFIFGETLTLTNDKGQSYLFKSGIIQLKDETRINILLSLEDFSDFVSESGSESIIE